MEYLAGFQTWQAAHSLSERLEKAGIAILIIDSGRDARRLSTAKYLVYSALDFQHEDAVQLMRNPKHTIAHPVDVAAYHAHMGSKEGLEAANRAITKGMLWMLAGVVLLVALIVWVSQWPRY
ncbi:hypothetical protein SDC9_75703 [bioreactor metagenome]|uniref:Uncharacterized protein n=1 Tax=bioreactor metagenome TaxID=1076179 RepID=A0A644YRR5_9ZZZZ